MAKEDSPPSSEHEDDLYSLSPERSRPAGRLHQTSTHPVTAPQQTAPAPQPAVAPIEEDLYGASPPRHPRRHTAAPGQQPATSASIPPQLSAASSATSQGGTFIYPSAVPRPSGANPPAEVQPSQTTTRSRTSLEVPPVIARSSAAGTNRAASTQHASTSAAPQSVIRTQRLFPDMPSYHGTQPITPAIIALRDSILRNGQIVDKGNGRLEARSAPPGSAAGEFDRDGKLMATSKLMRYYMDLRLFSRLQWQAMCVEWRKKNGNRAALSKVKNEDIPYEIRPETTTGGTGEEVTEQPSPQQPAARQSTPERPPRQRPPTPPFPLRDWEWGPPNTRVTIPDQDRLFPPHDAPPSLPSSVSRKATRARLRAERLLASGISQGKRPGAPGGDLVSGQKTEQTDSATAASNDQAEEENNSQGEPDEGKDGEADDQGE